jgi:hypothetical protein
MSLIYNTQTRNELAAAYGALFNAGTLEIRTAADAVLATITLPNPAFGAPATGVISKSGTWQATASGSGIAAKAVFISADTNKTATETIGESGAAIIIDNENIVAGGTVTVSTYTYTVPAGD